MNIKNIIIQALIQRAIETKGQEAWDRWFKEEGRFAAPTPQYEKYIRYFLGEISSLTFKNVKEFASVNGLVVEKTNGSFLLWRGKSQISTSYATLKEVVDAIRALTMV